MVAGPFWYDAAQHEWSCTGGLTPRVLTDPAICRTSVLGVRRRLERDPGATREDAGETEAAG